MSTATRLNLSIRETPQSVSIVTRQQMDDQNLQSISSVLERSVGITLNQNETDRFANDWQLKAQYRWRDTEGENRMAYLSGRPDRETGAGVNVFIDVRNALSAGAVSATVRSLRIFVQVAAALKQGHPFRFLRGPAALVADF